MSLNTLCRSVDFLYLFLFIQLLFYLLIHLFIFSSLILSYFPIFVVISSVLLRMTHDTRQPDATVINSD